MEGASGYHLALAAAFVIVYLLIIFENVTRVNKSTVALMGAVVSWLILFLSSAGTAEDNMAYLNARLCSVAQVVFFLLGALAIVEIISVHQGFRIISQAVTVRSKRALLWLLGWIAFVLSAVLDNLTTTIVMVTLARRLVSDKRDLWIIGGAIVIAANAGGAWTPIGDVTTTMLWIGGQISPLPVMKALLFPSLACLVSSLFWLSFMLKGEVAPRQGEVQEKTLEPQARLVFCLGLGALIFVPIFKMLTGLPPFMGMLLGLGVLWVITDLLHSRHQDRHHLRVPVILTGIDLPGALFFLGILLNVGALDAAGLLSGWARWLEGWLPVGSLLTLVLGLASAVVDNVPLVASTMSMYAGFPSDHALWHMLAYTVGTGGSLLIIGSAAGVAFMNLERVSFTWYVKAITLPAALGYLMGFAVYLLQQKLF